ncbi:MAG: phosphomannose isomerase type II C-terminal cupin domain [Candidatus Paceibacterota bacterium]
MIIKSNIFEVERPWGNFRQFTKNDNSTIKIITVKPNEILSLQSHAHRAEFWHVITGSGKLEIDGVVKDISVGDENEVEVGVKHRISAGEKGMQLLEIAIGEFDEEDIVHYEDKYGRV